MTTLETDRFKGAEKYEAYLRTPSGMLRSDLAWKNLQQHFPTTISNLRALDIGGGTGLVSLRLAKAGFQVVLLDSSAEMLAIARKTVETAGQSVPVTLRHAGADQLGTNLDNSAFHIVVCHNVLEFVDDAAAAIRDVASLLAPDGKASFLVRNRAGGVLKAAIATGDLSRAKEALEATTAVDSLFGQTMRVFTPHEIRAMLQAANLELLAEYGVRVFSDYVNLENIDSTRYAQLLDLESTLGAKPDFAAISRYSQFIVRPSSASRGITE